MRERILAMRKRCMACSAPSVPGRDFGYFLTQRGMFSYTGLSAAQVDRLREEHARLPDALRAACAWPGLNHGNVDRTAAGDGGGAGPLERAGRPHGSRARLHASGQHLAQPAVCRVGVAPQVPHHLDVHRAGIERQFARARARWR